MDTLILITWKEYKNNLLKEEFCDIISELFTFDFGIKFSLERLKFKMYMIDSYLEKVTWIAWTWVQLKI